MDYIRYPYRTKMKFYTDSDRETEVCWYYAAEDAKLFPGYTRFASGLMSHDKMKEWKGIGEIPKTPKLWGSSSKPCCEWPGIEPKGPLGAFTTGVPIGSLPPVKYPHECRPPRRNWQSGSADTEVRDCWKDLSGFWVVLGTWYSGPRVNLVVSFEPTQLHDQNPFECWNWLFDVISVPFGNAGGYTGHPARTSFVLPSGLGLNIFVDVGIGLGPSTNTRAMYSCRWRDLRPWGCSTFNLVVAHNLNWPLVPDEVVPPDTIELCAFLPHGHQYQSGAADFAIVHRPHPDSGGRQYQSGSALWQINGGTGRAGGPAGAGVVVTAGYTVFGSGRPRRTVTHRPLRSHRDADQVHDGILRP